MFGKVILIGIKMTEVDREGFRLESSGFRVLSKHLRSSIYHYFHLLGVFWRGLTIIDYFEFKNFLVV